MKNKFFRYGILLLLLLQCVLSMNLQAQLAGGQSKFLGNTHTQGQTPLNFDLYWNQITPGNAGKWASCEQNRDDFNYWLWFDRAYNHAKEFGMIFKEHTLVWGASSGEPAWMSSVPQDEQMDEVIEWFEAVAERYPGIDMIDVVNEPLHAPPSYKDALGGDGETGWDWVIWSFEKARELFPNAILILNEYNILNYTYECQNFLVIVNLLKEKGLIDAIGCQAHSLETISFSTIQTNLELLAATGLDIYISEYDVRGDDATQLAIYQEQFPYFWEHPSVKGITLWGYLEGDMWRSDAYLLAADGTTERPALQWLREYFDYYPQSVQYQFNTYVSGSGSVTLSPSGGIYDPFTDVSATAVPEEGYVFSSWTGDKGGSENPVVMAMTSNRSLTANFVEEGSITTYTLNVSVSVGGTVSQSPSGTTFAEGAVVTLTATPDNGYKFDGWSGSTSSTSSTIEITMDANKSLTASFSEIGGQGCDGETPISMNFEQNGVGEYCFVANGELEYINSWNVDYLEVNGQNFTNVWTNSIPASSDGLIHIHYLSTVSWAHFEMSGTDGQTSTSQFTLSTSANSGGSITMDPSGGIYDEGTVVTLTAMPDNGYAFSNWGGDASGTSPSLSVTMDTDKSITATFIPDTTVYYSLTIEISGSGTVSASPSGGSYPAGSEVALMAASDPGYVFEGWSGDISDTAMNISLLMDADKSVTATFVESAEICSSPVSVEIPLTQNGTGEYCWVTSDDIAYVNSWNTSKVEVNGIDFTNTYSNSLPARIDGNYYIYYLGAYSWSHLEIAGTKSTDGIFAAEKTAEVFPNPFTNSAILNISEPEEINAIEVLDQSGRIVFRINGKEVRAGQEIGEGLSSGVYFVRISSRHDIQVILIHKN